MKSLHLQHPITKAVSIAALLGAALEQSAEDPPARPVAKAARAAAPHASSASHAPDADADAPDAADAADDAAPAEPSACPSGMILVDGKFCPDAEQVCRRWRDDPPPYQKLRCAEYAKPSKCRAARVHKRFCIDREEYTDGSTNDAGEPIPAVHMSWLRARATCSARGARLCKESEWELACEGPDMSPYPYGWKRDSKICNIDRTDLGGREDKLIDHRAPLGAFPGCMSPYGVHDMVGNVDEFTERENVPAPYRNALHGGWWLPGRNRCRAATLGHPETYGGKQVGFRCCKDAMR